MIIRRILAGFVVFLFVIVALPTFFVYALSRTYFTGDFYQNEGLATAVHDFVVTFAADQIYQADPTIQKHFQPSDVHQEIATVFTVPLFAKQMIDFGQLIEKLKAHPQEPVTLSLKVLRESLLTMTHNLAYHLFENLPVCKTQQLPEVNIEGIPTCVPQGLDYGNISAPLSKQFEKAVYAVAPEQVQIDLGSSKNGSTVFAAIFALMDRLRFYLLIIMVVLMAMIALLLYFPLDALVFYESMAFLLSGLGGFFMTFFLRGMSSFFLQNYVTGMNTQVGLQLVKKDDWLHLMEYLTGFIFTEIQKIALLFLLLGALLFLLQIFLKRRQRFIS